MRQERERNKSSVRNKGNLRQRRERQRQMKNDEARPSPEAAREEFFPGV